jgi:thioredoxin reductase (NADPH)
MSICACEALNLQDEFDLVIAGSGIAGLSAAITAARLGRSTLVLSGDTLGGQLVSIDTIDGFPGFPDGAAGHDLCPMIQEQAAASGAEFMMTGLDRLDPQDGKWRIGTSEGHLAARAVILATGSTLKKLDVPGEARLLGKGVSQCASCDGPLHRDRSVAVVGGGDSAMQEALTLAEFAAKVVILHRGSALDGQKFYRERVSAHPKIEVRCCSAVTEILGDSKVTGLRAHNSQTGAGFELATAAVFAYVGLRPNSAFVRERIRLDSAERIPTDGAMRTQLIGICVAGNVRSRSPYRATSAAGDGATAAIAVDRYLRDGAWRED